MEKKTIKIGTGKRKIPVHIANQEFTLIISAHDFEVREVPNSYHDAFSKILWEKIDLDIDKRPNVEEIIKQNDDWFLSIFAHFFNEDALLRDNFDLLNDVDDVCERFEKAYYNKIISSIPKEIEKIQKALQELVVCTENIIKEINFNAVTSVFTDIIKSLHIPAISDDEKNRLISSYKSWGQYVCTIPPNVDIDCFSVPPENLREAEKFILQHCNSSVMEELFNNLCSKRGCKNEISEAIICYKNGHRIACASILFSIIDSYLIKHQGTIKTNTEITNKAKRKVGYNAKTLFEKQVKVKFEKSPLYIVLQYANIIECLNTIFSDTKDFSLDSKIINRHMVLHGMSKHPVRKIDCIKLFLLLYNLIKSIELLES